MIEASKQCGRNRLLEIAPPQAWNEYATQPTDLARYIAHLSPDLESGAIAAQGPVILAVGPEGGWTDEEVQLAIANAWHAIDLGAAYLPRGNRRDRLGGTG